MIIKLVITTLPVTWAETAPAPEGITRSDRVILRKHYWLGWGLWR